MEDEDEKYIAITHFINPHQFWYTCTENDNFSEVISLEESLTQRFINSHTGTTRHFTPSEGSIVAVQYMPNKKRFIRARVEKRQTTSRSNAFYSAVSYVVWAIDHGFPFETSEEYLRYLPEELTKEIDRVRCGGIAKIVPAAHEFNFLKQHPTMEIKNKWDNHACDLLERMLTDAASIAFSQKFKSPNGHCWGDLHIVNHRGILLRASDFLINKKMALRNSEIFIEMCIKSNQTQMSVWESNSGNSKYGNNKCPTVASMLDADAKACLPNEDELQSAKLKIDAWSAHNAKATNYDGSNKIVAGGRVTSYDSDSDDSVAKVDINRGVLAKSSGKPNSALKPNLKDFGIEDELQKDDQRTEDTSSLDQYSSVSKQLPSNTRFKYLLEMRKRQCSKQKSATAEKDSNANLVSNESKVDDEAKSVPLSEAPEKKQQEEPPSNDEVVDNISVKTNETRRSSDRSRYLNLLRTKHIHSTSSDKSDAASTVSSTTPKSAILQQLAKEKSTAEEEDSNANLDSPETNKMDHEVKSLPLLEIAGQKQDAPSRDDESADNVSVTSNETRRSSLGRSHYLNILRTRNALPKSPPKSDAASIVSSTTSKSGVNKTRPQKLENMIPAGFDLTNLNTYRDKNHWHRKRTTRNDKHPLDLSLSIEDENQQQDFRFTRDNTDKHKTTRNCEKEAEEKVSELNIEEEEEDEGQNKSSLEESVKVIRKDSPREINSFSETKIISTTSTPQEEPKAMEKADEQIESMLEDSVKAVKNDSPRKSNNFSEKKIISTTSTPQEEPKAVKKADEPIESMLRDSVKAAQNDSPRKSNNFSETKKISSPTKAQKEPKPHQTSSDSPSKKPRKSKKVKNGSNLEESFLSESSQSSDDSRYSSALSNVEDEVEEQSQKPKKISPDFIKPLEDKTKPKPTAKNDDQATIQDQITLKYKEKSVRMNFTQHLVLAHSQIQLYTAEKLENVFLAPSVVEEMKKIFVDRVYRVQSYAWSHMISGNGLFIVNSLSSGKTWSYIPPLCSSITFGIQNATTPPTYGPIAIVLVPSSENAIQIGNICSRLLWKLDATDAKIVVSYGVKNVNSTKIQLMESCAILVTTPKNLSYLMEFYSRNEPLFDPTRIQHIIVDDIDIILDRYKEDFTKTFKKLYALVPKIRGSKKMSPQLVVTSSMYQPMFSKLIPISNQPLLLVGDFLEAAVYGRAHLEIKLCQSEEKMKSVLNFIKKHSILHETLVILCNSEGDVLFVVEKLADNGILSIGFHKHSQLWVRQEVEDWKVQFNPTKVLVCSDDVFPELEIQNAQNLIHYSLARTWTKFTLRFMSLIKVYENLVAKGFEGPPPEKRATSLILLDENNNNELPRVIEFLRKHNQISRIPPDVLKLSKNIEFEREKKRCGDNIQLCHTLFELGECPDPRCQCRHVLTESDTKQEGTEELLQSGTIEFMVLNVFSPTHFSVHLLRHRPSYNSQWQIVRKSNEATTFAMRFNSFYYLEPDNLKMLWPVKVNDLCVCKKNDTFYRARVIECHEINTNVLKIAEMKLKLIDTGEVVHAESNEVFVCHDQFRDFPPQAVDVHVIGIRPCGNERKWDPASTNHMRSILKDKLSENEVVHANISFSLADGIWVDNVVIMENLFTLKNSVFVDSLKKNLIRNNYAVRDVDLIAKVHKLIEEHGFGHILDKTEPNQDSSQRSDKSVVQPEEEKVEPSVDGNQNESSDSKQDPSAFDGDVSEASKEENSDVQASAESSDEISLPESDKTSRTETPKPESPPPSLPTLADFNDVIMCLQRSMALEAEEYMENDETAAKDVEEFMRQTERLCKDAIKNHSKTKENNAKEKLKELEKIKSKEEEKEKEQKQNQNHSKELQKANEQIPLLPQLFNLHQRPKTVWYQTNYLIILSIHAPDVEDYNLEVAKDYLYFSAEVNGVQQVLILNFLGTIEPSLVSHEIRGLNVAVRLVKSLYVMWPRLVKQEEKIPWLMYNYNMISTKEMEDLLPQQFTDNALHAKHRRSGANDSDDDKSIDSDDDNECHYYVNDEDIHDPFSSELI